MSSEYGIIWLHAWFHTEGGGDWDSPPLPKFESYDVIIASTAMYNREHNFRLNVL